MKHVLNTTVVVSALGYFVDIYDLVLFSIVRVSSLRSLGVPEDRLLDQGVVLLNAQMWGLLLGGVVWGILGDRRGRVSVLFGSILMYSAANIANAFVTDVSTYGWLRFIAGVGLAGELGAAITLVSEVMSKETRGLGTMVVTTVGVFGAVVGGLMADQMHWRMAYIVGGVMGFVLLALRMKMFESGMYERSSRSKKKQGDFWMLFYPWKRFQKYAYCILMGIPIWFVIGILLTFAPELALATGVQGKVVTSQSILFGYLGFTAGDFLSGWLSHRWKTRRRVAWLFLGITWLATLGYLYLSGGSTVGFYTMCLLAGIGGGYWAVFMTNAAEQFGTNIRATVTTTVPNIVRGATVLITAMFQWARGPFGLIQGTLFVGTVLVAIAAWAVWNLKETHGKDLDYLE